MVCSMVSRVAGFATVKATSATCSLTVSSMKIGPKSTGLSDKAALLTPCESINWTSALNSYAKSGAEGIDPAVMKRISPELDVPELGGFDTNADAHCGSTSPALKTVLSAEAGILNSVRS